ncbi:MAG: helix-turn-helix domain-containing protein [Armatimonadetes bacterium]|nr:helix-turn-helix domain-containing protein [Armatimonadota bacterium]
MYYRKTRIQRQEAGLSLAALAAKSGVSRWRLIESELGNLELRPDELQRIHAAISRHSEERIHALRCLLGRGNAA